MREPVIVRTIAGRLLYGDTEPADFRSSEDDFVKAEQAYDVYMEEQAAVLGHTAHNALWSVMADRLGAREQYAYELGMRAGFRLAQELARPMPTLLELEQRALELGKEQG